MSLVGKKPTAGGAGARRRLLHVEIVEARGLSNPNPKAKSGDIDSFVKIQLVDIAGRPKDKETFQTTVVKDSSTPSFGQSFDVGASVDLNVDELPSVQFLVFHKSSMFSMGVVPDTPLGMFSVDLNDLPVDEVVDWYALQNDTSKGAALVAVTGELRIRIKLDPRMYPSTPSLSSGQAADEDVENPEAADLPPNELKVVVLQARKMIDKGTNTFVSLKLVGTSSDGPSYQKESTQTVKGQVNMEWNQSFTWAPVSESSLSLKVTVKNQGTFSAIGVPDTKLGVVDIPISDFRDKKVSKKFYKLIGVEGVQSGQVRGELEIQVQWRTSLAVLAEENKKMSTAAAGGGFFSFGGKAEVLDDDEDDFGDLGAPEEDDDDANTAGDLSEKERKNLEDEHLRNLNDIVVQSGDYQVQVHIIEARDLKGENLDTTSNPMVSVECFGQQQHTRVEKSCNSCVFDELLIFNMKNLDKDQFMQGVVRVSCKSVPLAGKLQYAKPRMIGSYAFDACGIYQSNRDHELYRQWVALMDDVDTDDVGVQGFLKLSVFILGPGDKQKVHDEEKEMIEEQQKEVSSGGDISSMVLSVPVIRKSWKYVVATIYKAQGLPVMDGKTGIAGLGTKAKTDAVMKMQIAGAKPFKTQTVTVEGETSASINPQFFCEIWYPISIPSSTNIVRLSMWDKDLSSYELIGNVVENFSRMKKGNGPGRYIAEDLRWYNIYGSPEFKTESAVGNIKKVAAATKKAFKMVGGEMDWKNWYNNVPERAPCYKGRVLLSFRVEEKRPSKFETPEVKPFLRSLRTKSMSRQTIDNDVAKMETKSIVLEEYSLRALIICGTDLPEFANGLGSTEKLRVRVSIGGVRPLTTEERKCDLGTCRWNASLSEESITLPKDLSQVPDIFIYLVKEDNRAFSFARFKVADLLGSKGHSFLEPSKWFLLEEDKSIDELAEDQFPGTVLIKLGFGPKRFANLPEVKQEWLRSDQVSKTAKVYQLRVHVYQACDLPSADSNGLCDPFMHVFFMGKMKPTKTVKKSLHPCYYQTLVFDDVSICDADEFQFAPQITFRLFDKDDIGSEYLGMFTMPLSDAYVNADYNIPGRNFVNLPDAGGKKPKWYNFFRERPGDGKGKLLVFAQLIPTNGQAIPVPNYDKLDEASKHLSIIPESKDCYIEMVAIGLRNLPPYRFQAVQNPFMEVSLNSLGAVYDSKTKSSKHPNPANPNFLEVIKMNVKLPVHSMFASPINIRVIDTRLGGYSKPVIGIGSIDLSTKLPWCLDTYIAPGKDLFVENIATSAVAAEIKRVSTINPSTAETENLDAAQKIKRELEQKRLQDDFIVSPQAPNIDAILARKVTDVDTGAGVFGALTHIKVKDGRSKKNKGDDAFERKLDWTEDDSELPPAWMLGRKKLDSDLETEMRNPPFETYDLYRGKIHGLLGSTVKVVGKFKGLIRVTEDISTPMLPKEFMDMLLKPRPYKIRLYVLRAIGLAKKDMNLDGTPAPSDPYLKVRLGANLFNDRDNALSDATDCDLYKIVEIDAELPGTSQLTIDIMDKDMIGSDDVIGSSVIDLEDRLFDNRWQQLGRENMISTGDDMNDRNRVRWATKPVERRILTVPGQSQPQGTLECFVDIMKPEESIIFPPEDVSLPPKQLFELRVVIWSAKDVPPMDSFEGMSDLFVKVIPEGCAAQETDTHWRAKKGKASWNWRLLFDVELGHNSRAMKFPHLRFQLWDRDILKWNDCAGETVIDMGKYYRKAFKKNVAIKLFEKKQGASALRAKRAEALKPTKVVDTGGIDVPPAENPIAGGGKPVSQRTIVYHALVSNSITIPTITLYITETRRAVRRRNPT